MFGGVGRACRASWPGPHTAGSLLLLGELGCEVRAGEDFLTNVLVMFTSYPAWVGGLCRKPLASVGGASSLMDLLGTEAWAPDFPLQQDLACLSLGHCTA